MLRTGPNPSAIRRANARRAVGEHLNVQWTDATVTPSDTPRASRKEAIDAALQTLSYPGKPAMPVAGSAPSSTAAAPASENATPSLIFVYTTVSTKPKSQAQDCEAAWEELFHKESDFSVFIPGRFFNVLRVNVTQIKESANNKHLCSEKAPLVILTRANGEIEEVLEGKVQIKSSAVTTTMCDILRKDGFLKKSSSIPELNGLMVALQKAEEAMILGKEDLGKVKARLAETRGKAARKVNLGGKSNKDTGSASVVSAQKSVDSFEKKLKDAQTEKFDILSKEYAMLQELGLPPSKMPPKPASP